MKLPSCYTSQKSNQACGVWQGEVEDTKYRRHADLRTRVVAHIERAHLVFLRNIV